MLLTEQECLGGPEWAGGNKRSATRQAMGGSIARDWLGDAEEEERAGANGWIRRSLGGLRIALSMSNYVLQVRDKSIETAQSFAKSQE